MAAYANIRAPGVCWGRRQGTTATIGAAARMFAACLFAALIAAGARPRVGAAPPPGSEPARRGPKTPADWIAELGHDVYARRERAEAALRRMGLQALDVLHEARWHADIEIATRAARLIEAIEVQWALPGDPPQVKAILRRYPEEPVTSRPALFEQLAHLESSAGLVPLARLARYERSEVLSKEAALVVVALSPPRKDAKAIAARIRKTLGTSRRPAATWIRSALASWDNPQQRIAMWNQLAQEESQRFVVHPGASSRKLLRIIYRGQASALWRSDRQAEAREAASRYLEMVEDKRHVLLEAADWFVDRGWPSLVAQLRRRFDASFREHPDLFFRLAEAYRRTGKEKRADTVADEAWHLLQTSGPFQALMTALRLERDGYFHWAMHLYRRHLPQDGPPTLAQEILAARSLAELLYSLERFREAADVYDKLIRPDAEAEQRQRIERLVDMSSDELASRAAYFRARYFEKAGRPAELKKTVRRAIQLDAHNIEALILAYRASRNDAAWRSDVRRAIREAVAWYQESIQHDRKELVHRLTPSQRRPIESHLALLANQVAWLVANTEGDGAWALEMIEMALQYQPDNAAYLDTLARCHFALGDLDKAIRWQRKALALDPHSPPLKRNLEFFLSRSAQRPAKNASHQRR